MSCHYRESRPERTRRESDRGDMITADDQNRESVDVGLRRAVQDAFEARGGEPGPSTSARYASPFGTKAGEAWIDGPPAIRLALSILTQGAECDWHRPVGDRGALPSPWLCGLLAVEVARASRLAACPERGPPTDPRNQWCQPFIGCVPHPGRVAEARYRCGVIDRREVYEERPTSTFTVMEDFPAKPFGWHRIGRLLRHSDDRL